ncbi:MAG: hypothetical protein EBR94_01065 [Bacteroidetes bacterium]|nr:hypothetical protein [Bacteroidota bacterium]
MISLKSEEYIGSIWKTKTKGHYGRLRKIVGFNKNSTSVRVKEQGKITRQHASVIYSINIDVFVREHDFIRKK